ncbi:MAG: MBL fold metallo-hydrolase [Myxococcota bacterium]
MRIHHLNAATMCPAGGRLLVGNGNLLTGAHMVCHCLLVETDAGLVLVDTGLGLQDVATPGHLGAPFLAFAAPRLLEEETAARQVERLGFRREDVRHIVLTHLDLDHAGGLPDFPHARVHVHAPEHQAAMSPRTLNERERYRPLHWKHGPQWRTYAAQGEPWFGFECVRQLEGLPPEILIVPLTGHTRGHSGIAVSRGGRWLLHCGDAYFFHGEMDPAQPHCPAGLKYFQALVQAERQERLHNQHRLRELVRNHADDVDVFCAHDPLELARAKERNSAAARAA